MSKSQEEHKKLEVTPVRKKSSTKETMWGCFMTTRTMQKTLGEKILGRGLAKRAMTLFSDLGTFPFLMNHTVKIALRSLNKLPFLTNKS